MSETHKNRPPDSFKTRLKKSKSAKGRIKSKEHIEKIKQVACFKKGHTPWNKGKVYKKKSNKVILNTQTGIYYESYEEASEQTSLKAGTLRCKLIGEYENNTPFILTNG